MRWMLLSLALACAVGCSSPPAKSHPTKPDTHVPATSDREHPQRLSLQSKEHTDYGELYGRAPGPGDWWYLVEFPRVPAAEAKVEFYIIYGSPHDSLSVTWIDEHGEAHPPTDTTSGSSLIAVPKTRDAPTTYLLRVTTTRRVKFSFTASREWWEERPPEPPPCDRDHIDASNPNCEGVYPRCKLNEPDFKNPNCCNAACLFGKLSCKSKILRGDTRWAYIGIGADQEIMRGATGKVVVKNLNVADVIVWHVDEHESFLQIMPFKTLDNDMLKDAVVILSQPTECVQRPGFVLPAHE